MIPGELVNLRAIERSDARIVHCWLNDPQVMRGWGWTAPARSFQSVAQEIEDWLAQEATLGRPAALLAETIDGEPLGLVILRVDRPEARSVELSLLVGDPSQWGQGFGADILHTTLDACFGGWGIHRLAVRVEDNNERAVSLYRRFGFTEEGRLRQAAFRDGRHGDILLFGLLAPEWRGHEDDATTHNAHDRKQEQRLSTSTLPSPGSTGEGPGVRDCVGEEAVVKESHKLNPATLCPPTAPTQHDLPCRQSAAAPD